MGRELLAERRHEPKHRVGGSAGRLPGTASGLESTPTRGENREHVGRASRGLDALWGAGGGSQTAGRAHASMLACLRDPGVAQGCRVRETGPEPVDVAEASGLSARCSVLCSLGDSQPEPPTGPESFLTRGCALALSLLEVLSRLFHGRLLPASGPH